MAGVMLYQAAIKVIEFIQPLGYNTFKERGGFMGCEQLMPRREIADILDNVSADSAVYVVAPYGCGKTYAVMSWLSMREGRFSRVELAATDNSIDAFIAKIAHAVSPKASDWNEASKVLFQAEPDEDNVLVLDNFEFIQGSGLLRFVRDLVAECLGRWRVIIISRAVLPFIFNDLLLRGRVRLITLKELRFSERETAEYLQMNGCSHTEEGLVQICKETAGWPAALNAILTTSGVGPAVYGEEARVYVNSFFETQIWAELDVSTREFLLKTSVLTKLTPWACGAVTGLGAMLPIIQGLYMKGLFISRLDELETYRYHRVFQDFLRQRLKSSGIDEKALCSKIAWRMHERGEYAEAFGYFFKASDLYGLSCVMRIMDPAEMGLEKYVELTECLTTLNISDLKTYPALLAKIAMLEYVRGNISEMKSLYRTFAEWMDEIHTSPEEYAEYVWERGWLCYLDPGELVLNNTKHSEWNNYKDYVPHLKTLHRARAAALRPPSILSGIRDYSSVTKHIEAFLKQFEEGKPPVGIGDVEIREQVSIWEAYLILAEYLYEIEEFKKSQEIALRIIALAEDARMTDLYFVCTVLLVKLLRAMNRSKEIKALTDRLESMIIAGRQYFMLPNLHAFQLRNRITDGEAGDGGEFAGENAPYADKQYFFLFYRHMTMARLRISVGEYSAALVILGGLELQCHKYRRIIDLMEVNILKSAAIYGLGDEETARGYLTKALQSGKEYGYRRIFSDDAKLIWPVLEQIAGHKSDSYTKLVFISCKKSLKTAGYGFSTKESAHTRLTKTELSVLKALQMDMSYDEIASDRNISLSTVKSHAHSIYSKLGVDNRTSALIAARESGIL